MPIGRSRADGCVARRRGIRLAGLDHHVHALNGASRCNAGPLTNRWAARRSNAQPPAVVGGPRRRLS
jgi:hypothetical protein